jgi:hypothetical protein
MFDVGLDMALLERQPQQIHNREAVVHAAIGAES